MIARALVSLWVELSCLEDTGSPKFSVFKQNDLFSLGAGDDYHFWLPPIEIQTENGSEWRRAYYWKFRQSIAQGLRSALLTSALDGVGLLHISMKKNSRSGDPLPVI